MKLAEVVAKYLESIGLTHAFGVNGGACLHLIHGLTDVTQVKFIPTAHEQGAGFAADAFARLNGLGCAMATSGPGATNLITACAASYQDSVPTLFVTGNVATFRFGRRFGVRAYGFQELDIVAMAKGITKYAVQVTDPAKILYCLEAAVWIARQGRPGPVLVDIPDDLQRMDVDWEALEHFGLTGLDAKPQQPDLHIAQVADWLRQAERPLFVWGAGVRAAATDARALARALGVPVACTWGAIDLMPADDPLMCGGFGTHGTRPANFAVQNADLIISLGCRLDTKATGEPKHFARGAKIVMVDLDAAELGKFEKLGRKIDLPIQADCGVFVKALAKAVDSKSLPHERHNWSARICGWRMKYAPADDSSWTGVKPYAFLRELARYTTPDDIIVSDTGNTYGWIMQGFPFKGERFIHACNLTPMGYGLGAAVGASLATGRRVVCLVGDGGALMSLSELATIRRHNLNVKVILFDNQGHAMCRHTQRQWLGGTYPATSIEGGLGLPEDWAEIVNGFGIGWCVSLDDLFEDDLPRFCELSIDPAASLATQARFGKPIEDSDPALPREELRSQMIVPLIKERQ